MKYTWSSVKLVSSQFLKHKNGLPLAKLSLKRKQNSGLCSQALTESVSYKNGGVQTRGDRQTRNGSSRCKEGWKGCRLTAVCQVRRTEPVGKRDSKAQRGPCAAHVF